MKQFLEFLSSIRFDTTVLGIQKNLLLASLIGVVSNLPKNIKSNFLLAVHIVTGTLLSTILTPFIIVMIEHLLTVKLPVASGYGIASLIGIVGVNSIKKLIVDKLGSSKSKESEDDNK
jgi:hypothetical protein